MITIHRCQGCPFMSFMNRMETCTLYHETIDCDLNKKASFCTIIGVEPIEEKNGDLCFLDN